MTTDEPDYAVTDEGTLFLFRPVSDAAREHGERMFADAMQMGPSYAVEHRYAADILHDLIENEGFAVDLDGRRVVSFTSA